MMVAVTVTSAILSLAVLVMVIAGGVRIVGQTSGQQGFHLSIRLTGSAGV